MPDPTVAQQRRLIQFFVQSIRNFPQFPVVISEGDSWYSFPIHANIIDHLDVLTSRRMSLLRIEDPGDELLAMTSGAQRRLLRQLLSTYPVDILLFSGGGNDVVGEELLDFLVDQPAGGTWRDALNLPLLDRIFRQIEDAYVSLIHLRDTYRPGCVIITHGYDYLVPTGKQAHFLPFVDVGPWIKRYLEMRKITDPQEQQDVVIYLIDRFNEILQRLAGAHGKFVALDNRRLLSSNEWNDEIHPTRSGFLKLAQRFHNAMRTAFPAKFP